MRILAFSDIHGKVEAVEKLYKEAKGLDYDIILFAGDFTNTWFDGIDNGQKQMDEIISVLKKFNKPLYYVYGNRDFDPFTLKRIKNDYGYNLEKEDVEIGEYTLTNKEENLDKSKILVNHFLSEKYKMEQANCLLYCYGHDHIGRIFGNYLDLGFLYRGTEAHGAKVALYGCYWIITIKNSEAKIENYNWQLKKVICELHPNQGLFYIPYYWKKCPVCYDSDNELNFKSNL